MRKIVKYSSQQQAEFVELAQIVGIARAIRELGYPTWPTGQAWCKSRGVEPALDTVMQEVKRYHTFMETQDALLIAEEGMAVAREMLLNGDMTADDFKKIAEGYVKFVNAYLTLQGKATSISEAHKKDSIDLEVMALLNAEKARQVIDESSRDLESRSTEA